MKVYYWESAAWNLMSGIVSYPNIAIRNNMPGLCSVIIRSFHDSGTQFADWNVRDFTLMKVEDEDSNVLFRGFLINKQFFVKILVIHIVGFSIILDWTPFYKNYILAEGLVKTSPAGTSLVLWRDVDKDEIYDGAPDDFGWEPDYWITDQNVGLLIVNNTSDLDTENWECSTISITGGGVEEAGDKDSLDSQDGDSYYGTENSNDWNDYITIVLGEGTPFATAKKIHSIKITYRIGVMCELGGQREWFLKVKNSDNDWFEICHIVRHGATSIFHWETDTFTIPKTSHAELLKFLTVDGADYDEVTELRLSWTASDPGVSKSHVKIDVLTAEIEFYTDEIIPIMKHITDSGANSVDCVDVPDWAATGVIGYDGTPPGDIFRIGENTRTVIENIATAIAPIPIEIIGQEGTEAGTEVLRPDGDTLTGFQSHSDDGGDGSHWKNIEEVVVDPNAGDGAYIRSHAGGVNADQFTMGTFVLAGANVVTKLELKIYHKKDIVYFGRINIYTTSTGWIEEKYPVHRAGYIWDTFTWDNLHLSQADIDSLQIKFSTTQTLFPGAYWWIDTAYVVATYGAYAPFDRFIARIYRGTHTIDGMKSVCDLEGADWMEDHANYRIKLMKPDAYEVSDVIITEDEYDDDWEYEDKCNQVKRFDVYGNASYNIHETYISETAPGSVARQLIDESIATAGDAMEVATAQGERLEAKRPSLKITLTGTYPNLQLGKTINVTLARPNVGAVDYKIRMIERSKFGINDVKTIVYCGLGETSDDERIGKSIQKIAYLANKALADRLISTPWASGASITVGDIGGFTPAVDAIVAAAGHDTSTWSSNDPVANDYDKTDFTLDSTWREKDISAFIRSGARWAFIKCSVKDAATSRTVRFRSTAQVNGPQVVILRTQTANVFNDVCDWIPINSSGVIDYYMDDFDFLYITILGDKL